MEPFVRRENKNNKLAERRAEEKAEKRKAIETATEMKKDGFAIAKIVKYTGLSIEDIEKL